jgi:hypothetical protein
MNSIMDFDNYVKHLRYYGNHINEYHHKEVEKNFYKVLDKLGEPTGTDDAVFITLRLKSKSDWIIANNACNALEWKLCKFFWKRKGKKMLETGTAPYVSSIEHNLIRIKDHIHAIIRLKDLKQYYSHQEIENKVTEIAYQLNEVNAKSPDAVKVRIFPFCDRTEKEANEVGNSLEYICKTSSKYYNPLSRKILSNQSQNSIKTKL